MKKILLLAVCLLVAGGVAAYASIPDAAGVIHGCYATKGGTLRVIDTDAGQTCGKDEVALSWNQTGPQGPAGPAGAPATALWAVVNSVGGLVRGSHVVSAQRDPGNPTGLYDVTFDQPVSACAALATLGSSAGGAAISVQNGDDSATVRIQISGQTNFVDAPFQVAVFC